MDTPLFKDIQDAFHDPDLKRQMIGCTGVH